MILTEGYIYLLTSNILLLWRIDPLLSSDSVNSVLCKVTPTTYTFATIK
jgi:hypothetical protein